MKLHTSAFKENIKNFGRELDSIISYTLNGETIELGGESLNSVTPHYQGAILKSVMKQLDIDSNVDIPIGTQLNYQFGIKIENDYEYLDFGNYIVYSSEKQEDTNSYKIICYDKMLYSMKDYVNIGVTYPITIRNYINSICNYLGITFANSNDTFANYNRQINTELYLDSGGNSLGYTFRDVLDEIAQVTASTICINNNDNLEIRYINNTGDTIDEEYLKDINVNFGEKYGPINTIVLSRSAGTDKVYLSHPEDLPDEEKNAIEINDNQIMNFNDRADYLPDILNKLNGLEYYLNDYSSTGICYFDLCDRYNVAIGENNYSCVMFNDEINVTQGLEEKVYTDMPEESENDYTKADKTDRKINQTYLIVDKQNQAIEGVVSQITNQSEQIASIRLQYNELISKISDVADITTSAEDTDATVSLANINSSQPISIKIHPIVENISYLYPYNGLYPSSNLYPKSRKLRFTNTTTNEIFDWILPTDLWYYDSNNYDELELSYGDGSNSNVIVNRKCKINADNSVSVLTNPTTETYSYPSDILLTDGDYTVSLVDNTMGYLYVQLMAQNIYTTQFYTKAETNSIIDQTASNINLSVSQTLSNYSTTSEMNSAINIKANEISSVVSTKVGNNEVISKINQTAETITISASKVNISGVITAINNNTSTTINGSKITTGSITASQVDSSVITTSNLSAQTINADKISGGTISSSSINIGTSSYYLRMGSNWTRHPEASGLNITGSGGININGLGFNNSGGEFNFAGGVKSAYITATTQFVSNGNAYVYGGLKVNNINPGGVLNLLSGGSSGSASNTGILIRSGAGHITIDASNGGYNSSYYAYVRGGSFGTARIGTDSSGPSSKCLKKNIVKYSKDEYNEALELLEDINIYNYQYKYKIHDKKEQYGFIIDELLDNKLADKFLYFKDEKAIVNDNNSLDYLVEEENEKDAISFKRYDEETLIKYLLVVCKALQNKLNKLEGNNE